MTDWSRSILQATYLLADSTAPSTAQYVATAAVGLSSGLGGAVFGALAVILNGNRQRSADQALALRRIAESRKGTRREIGARLRELAGHVAAWHSDGLGEMGATLSTLDRLQTLMASESGPASLESDELTRDVYAMLEHARRNLRTLEIMTEKDRETAVAPAQFQDWLERSGLLYSNVIEATRKSLLGVFEKIGDQDGEQILVSAEGRFKQRSKAYSERLDAEREMAARAVRAALIQSDAP